MTITNNTKIAVEQTSGVVPELALVEAGANLTEAVPVTMTGIADAPDWTYSATTEDNGTAGNLDGQPGLTYSGPTTNHFRVKITNFDTIEHAITLPEATDKAVMAIYKNSEVIDFADEGFTAHASEIAVEFNIDTVAVLQEGDVLRVGMNFTGEVDGDLDLAPGEISIT